MHQSARNKAWVAIQTSAWDEAKNSSGFSLVLVKNPSGSGDPTSSATSANDGTKWGGMCNVCAMHKTC